jgi:hypothetical protein
MALQKTETRRRKVDCAQQVWLAGRRWAEKKSTKKSNLEPEFPSGTYSGRDFPSMVALWVIQ